MGEYTIAGNALVCAALVLTCAGPLVSAPNIRDVDCQKQSLGDAINKADPGDTLRVSGTCRERIVVTVDRLTLDGQGAAILDGGGPGGGSFSGAIVIDGARGVTVRGFTIYNSSTGILGLSNASLKVQNTVLRNNTDGMLILNGSIAEITDCTVIDNVDGIDVVNGSTAIFHGSVRVNNNGKGISAFGSSGLELRGGMLEASGNRSEGISMSGSSFNIFGIPESLGSSLTVNENATDGMLIGGGQLVIEANEPGSRVITALNNKGSGINLPGFASVANLGAAKFILKGNAVGLNLGIESSLLTVGGLNVEGNGTGLLADGAGSLTVISIPPNPSAIQGNILTDTDLRFGTRMTVNGAALGNLKCDGTVLIRGTTKCP